MRAVLIFLCLIFSALSAYWGQPLVRDNELAVTVIITATTVFAGFLVAIITILGDPAMIPEGSWREGEIRRDGVEAKLIRHLWLFVFYLVAIGLLFISVLLNKAPGVSETWKVWIERLYLFFAISSFLFTFGLPGALIRLQLARVDAEIHRRKKPGSKAITP